jgi:tRNA pseudouridine38-40 synthase
VTLFDPTPPGPAEPVVRARMLVAYDGTGFHGFARNPGVRTVAGALTEALERVLGHRVELTGAGRTDRGVHAWGQVVTFDARADRFDPVAVAASLNKLLGPAIAIRAADIASSDFDARFSATGRVYRYHICNRSVHDPFVARTAWHVAAPLELAAMRLGADALIGEHDFSSFCRKPPAEPDRPEPSRQRTVRRTRFADAGDGLIVFEIEADAFCHQMVRSIVGTLVDMGRGRRRAGEMLGIVAARDRAAAGRLAPPEGLVLWAVRYDSDAEGHDDRAPGGGGFAVPGPNP